MRGVAWGSDAPIGDSAYDRNAELWGGTPASTKERDRALESIMAEWSSGDAFAAWLPDLLATPKADEIPDGVTDHSASDWFFCRGDEMWGDLPHGEDLETNSSVRAPSHTPHG